MYQRVRQAAAKSAPLPAEIENEGVRLATRSWPVSLVLAQYFAQMKNASSAATLVNQFLELAAAEPDARRRDYFRSDVVRMTTRLTMMCAPGATSRLTAVLKTQFQIESHERDGNRAGSTEDTAT